MHSTRTMSRRRQRIARPRNWAGTSVAESTWFSPIALARSDRAAAFSLLAPIAEPPPRRPPCPGQAAIITEEDRLGSGATRVDQLRPSGEGQPGDSSRAAEIAVAACQGGTSPIPNRAASAAAATRTAASAPAPRRPGRPGQHRIGRQVPAPPSEHRPDRLDPAGEAPQPAPHRLRRPTQQRGDQPVSGPGRLRGQPRPDHRGGVRTADQQHHRQHHMRGPAAGAPRPDAARSTTPRRCRGPAGPAHGPTGPDSRASRTRQPARSEPFLDAEWLCHQTRSVSTVSTAPPSATHTALPPQPGQGHSGRAVAYPDPKIVTVTAPTNQVNATRPRSVIRTLKAPEQPYIVIPEGGQQPCRSQRRLLRKVVAERSHAPRKEAQWLTGGTSRLIAVAANTVSSRNRYSGESGQCAQFCDLRYCPCGPTLFRRSPPSRDRMRHE